MSKRRSQSEIASLKAESERRIRAGESRAEIARDLGVPPSTIGGWASDGRWRRKDLAFDLDEERGRATLAGLARQAAERVEATQQRIARVRQLGDAALAAIKAADPGEEGRPPGMAPASTHQISMQLAHDLMKEGRLEEADRAARFALRFAKAQQITRDREADAWREDKRKITEWWTSYHQGFDSFHKYASELIAEFESRNKYEALMHDFECCPACSRPMEFWPAQMDEKQGRIMDEIEMNDL